jgi:hypothetical protein
MIIKKVNIRSSINHKTKPENFFRCIARFSVYGVILSLNMHFSMTSCHIFACDLIFLLASDYHCLLVNDSLNLCNIYVFVHLNVLIVGGYLKQKLRSQAKMLHAVYIGRI